MEEKYQVFISYRRDGGEDLARNIKDRLSAKGFKVFFDVEALRSGDFNEALFQKIEECQDVMVILPPGGLDRCVNEDDWVRLEVARALKLGKNVIPVMQRNFEWPKNLPDDIAALQRMEGVSASNEYFDAVIDRIVNQFLKSIPRSGEISDEKLKRAAEDGDVDAMGELGLRYEFGSPTLVANQKKAVELYQKTAELGNPAGLYNLADVYEKCSNDLTLVISCGFPEEYHGKDADTMRRELLDRAADLYRKAAEAGFLPAYCRLGNLAENDGEYQKAFEYYKAAAEKGYPPAQNSLGYYLYHGIAGKADQQAARQLYQKAAGSGYAPAVYNYARTIEFLDLHQAIDLYRQITYGNYFIPEAAYALGGIYEQKLGDYENAITYYRIAMEAGIDKAQAAMQRCQDKYVIR